MTKKEVVEAVANVLDTDKKSRVYYRNQERPATFGKFVRMADHEQMFNRGYVRFLPDGSIPEDASWTDWKPRVIDTKLLLLEQIAQIRNF